MASGRGQASMQPRARRDLVALIAMAAACLAVGSSQFCARALAQIEGAATPSDTPAKPAPEISVEPPDVQIACEGSFTITIRNSGSAGSALVIDQIRLWHEYGEGYYGTGFTWDATQLEPPISLTGHQWLVIPVSYRGPTGFPSFPSALHLEIYSNAANNPHVFDTYLGGLCDQTPTPTPTCGPIAGLTDCQTDSDCVVVDRIDCCPCSMGGHQAAINRDKQDDLSGHLAVCCAAAGICPDVYSCEPDLAAQCQSGTCGLVSASPTPIPTPNECNPASPECPAGTECYCCCGAFRCLPPGVPCCALACVLPTPPTPAAATPTPSRGECVGDCNDDGIITIGELILGVNITLGNADVSVCPALQCERNGEGVFVNCLLAAVNDALYGCPGPKPSPTATSGCTTDADCNDGIGCTVDRCVNGACERVCVCLSAAGEPNCCGGPGELCVPPPTGTPEPTATSTPMPTPILPHGHTCCGCDNAACTDFSWVEVEPVCPVGCQTFMDAECETPCHGGPESGVATCVSLIPCASDADCDDGNACTIDRCTLSGCTHACVCL